MELNNPANRLLAIVEEGKKEKRNRPAVEAWSNILNVPNPKKNKSLLLTRIGQVMNLPRVVQTEIEKIENIDHKIYLKWLSTVEQAFSLNFESAWSNFIDKFKGEITYGIQICGDHLSRNRPEKVADSEKLASLLEHVKQLIIDLEYSEIPIDLKTFIYEHLCIVRDAIEEYKIRGIKPLEAEVDLLTGVVARTPSVWRRIHDTKIGRRFWKVMGNVALLTSISVGQFQIGQEIYDIFSGEKLEKSEQVNIYIIDINANISSNTNILEIKNDNYKALPQGIEKR